MPTRSQIKKGDVVLVETKENQGTGNLTKGTVDKLLTSSESHPHGIKVRLRDGQVGRVKEINSSGPAVDLKDTEIPKTEDQAHEFKEFYQYDRALEDTDDKGKIRGIKESVQQRFAKAICSSGNSRNGGLVYLGINSDGVPVGLERDKRFGEFTDYEDRFANHMRDTLERLVKDRAFIIGKLQIDFQEIDDKTICVIRVSPATQPLYLHTKEKAFYVRGTSPRAEKLDGSDEFRYIKDRFPNYT